MLKKKPFFICGLNKGVPLLIALAVIISGFNFLPYGIKHALAASANGKSGNVARGIVEENNTALGYITLYSKNRSVGGQPYSLKTYGYLDPNAIEVFKNHKKAAIEDVEAGDTAYIKTDDGGNVLAISAVSNYTVRYGRIISRSSSRIAVEYDDGTQQALALNDGVLVVENSQVAGINRLRDGDRVRLLLNITERFTHLKEITVEGGGYFIANIYKGSVAYIDEMSRKLTVLNLEAFDRGRWRMPERKGFTSIKMAENCALFFEERPVDIKTANKLLKNAEAYIAAEKDYGNGEKAVVVSFRERDDPEVLFDDSISNIRAGDGSFELAREYKTIKYGGGSIIVKYGRLVSGNSISKDDLAYVAANRSYDSGGYFAGVVQIKERSGPGFAGIYRGRIKQINENRDFMVESFSEFNGTGWEYCNTPKTFGLGPNTMILDGDGIVGLRDFRGYGENSFIGRTVYVAVQEGIEAMLISTAPYGIYMVRGEIRGLSGGSVGEEGGRLEEPDGIVLRDAKKYDQTSHMWTDCGETSLNILKNTAVLRNNSIVSPSELREGDIIRAIGKEDGGSSDAYIILVEE